LSNVTLTLLVVKTTNLKILSKCFVVIRLIEVVYNDAFYPTLRRPRQVPPATHGRPDAARSIPRTDSWSLHPLIAQTL
jgi:hypothetical protein